MHEELSLGKSPALARELVAHRPHGLDMATPGNDTAQE